MSRVRDVPNAAGPLVPFLKDLKSAAETLGRESVSRSDLIRLGVAVDRNGSLAPPAQETDWSTPPAPVNVTFTIGTGVVLIEWEGMGYPGHAFTQILRSATDDISTAEIVGQSAGGIFVDSVGVGSSVFYYWLRFVNRAGRVGPPNAQLGHEAQTAQSVANLIDALTEAAENPAAPYSKLSLRADMIYAVDESTGTNSGIFSVVTTPINNNGVLVPTGVYVKDLFVANGAITNAKIGNLAVDNAKIANMSVAKLTAGSLSVGEYIQSQGFVSGSSGWRIHSNGSGEFQNVLVRGTVYATSGSFAGDISGATGTFYGGVRGGSFAGYGWPAGSGQGFYLGPGGLLLGNPANGRWVQIEENGNINMPGFSVINGNANFSGTLSIDNGSGTKLVITNSQIQVWVGGQIRLQLGVGF